MQSALDTGQSDLWPCERCSAVMGTPMQCKTLLATGRACTASRLLHRAQHRALHSCRRSSSLQAAPKSGAFKKAPDHVVQPGAFRPRCAATGCTTTSKACQVDRMSSSSTSGSGAAHGRQLATCGGGGSGRAASCGCTTGMEHGPALLPPRRLVMPTMPPIATHCIAPLGSSQPAAAENVRLEDVESTTLRAGACCVRRMAGGVERRTIFFRVLAC